MTRWSPRSSPRTTLTTTCPSRIATNPTGREAIRTTSWSSRSRALETRRFAAARGKPASTLGGRCASSPTRRTCSTTSTQPSSRGVRGASLTARAALQTVASSASPRLSSTGFDIRTSSWPPRPRRGRSCCSRSPTRRLRGVPARAARAARRGAGEWAAGIENVHFVPLLPAMTARFGDDLDEQFLSCDAHWSPRATRRQPKRFEHPTDRCFTATKRALLRSSEHGSCWTFRQCGIASARGDGQLCLDATRLSHWPLRGPRHHVATIAATSGHAQTGRTLSLIQPAAVGSTMTAEVSVPATSNGLALGWWTIAEYSPAAQPVPLPFNNGGLYRGGALLGMIPWNTMGPAPFVTQLNLNVPAMPTLAGFQFDVQTFDLTIDANNAWFASWSDNDLERRSRPGAPRRRPTTSSIRRGRPRILRCRRHAHGPHYPRRRPRAIATRSG